MNLFITSASDVEKDETRKLKWGDFHFAQGLRKALRDLGHDPEAEIPDVLIHLYGMPVQALPDWTFNVLWIHSHPDTLTADYVRQYDQVYCLSPQYLPKLWEMGITDAKLLVGATAFEPMDVPLVHDAVFVANAKAYMGNSRAIINALGDLNALPFKLEIWGEGWKDLPEGIWQGEYYPYEKLNELYAASAVVINDEHTDMAEHGFINPRALDAIAAGSCVVTMPNEAYKILGLPVTTFDSIDQITGAIASRKAGTFKPLAMNPYRFSDMAKRIVAGIPERRCVDVGCGRAKRPGFIGVDKVNLPGVDMVFDITKQWLLEPDSVDYFVLDNLLEHIGDEFIAIMNNCWNTVKAKGRMHVVVPSATTSAAFQDPTHVRYFVPETWDYFDSENPRYKEYGASYGIKPWAIIKRVLDNRFIIVDMRPVKGG